ncbi:cytochrome C [Methylomonas sp. AM2-LC]|uniref:cytochrome C n=1 Tax=Methylomonas sp. AM2-LC TaxID=3153301 RepID=UPI003266CC3E
MNILQRSKSLNKRQLLIVCELVFFISISNTAFALPSFTRQTGMACISCHTQAFGPNLTPLGRQFKLNAYSSGGGDSFLSRFGGTIQGSLTNTKRNDDKFINPDNPNFDANFKNRGYNSNNNLALDQASVFFGGKVLQQMGAFVQFSYDGIYNRLSLDNTDIRLSSESDVLDKNLIYGISFNNNPTVQDLWNTTPAWGFPYVGSSLANTPAVGPIIGALGQQVGGATLYSMIDDLVFLEAGAYTSFAKYAQKGLGEWDNGAVKIDGGAPYWRIALQKDWHGHYFSLGHFGFRANIQPNVNIAGTDRYTDLGMDFNYQYLANPLHIYEVKASYIREQQELLATANQGGATHPQQQIGFLGLNGSYTYDQTYSFAAGFNHLSGSTDTTLYASPTNKPNSEYFTFELDYVPFGKTASAGIESYLNIRFALQYVAYTRFNGSSKNYTNVQPGDTGMPRNASDNNTLYLNTWLIF